jgi:hypothetical protein
MFRPSLGEPIRPIAQSCQGGRRKGNRASHATLGFALSDAQDASLQIDVFPVQGANLFVPHPGIQRQYSEGVQRCVHFPWCSPAVDVRSSNWELAIRGSRSWCGNLRPTRAKCGGCRLLVEIRYWRS